MERVFQRFVRLYPARPAGSHHGIGLALVRALCMRLGLSVAAENAPDGSLAFSVRALPGAQAVPPETSGTVVRPDAGVARTTGGRFAPVP